jgi:hypothetical protein
MDVPPGLYVQPDGGNFELLFRRVPKCLESFNARGPMRSSNASHRAPLQLSSLFSPPLILQLIV